MKRNLHLTTLPILLVFAAICTGCQITDKNSKQVSFGKFERHTPSWAYHNDVYVFNVRQYTTKGDFRTMNRYIPRLNGMNVGIFCFMPIQELGPPAIEGHMPYPYAILDYYKLDPDIEDETDFKWRIEQLKRQDRRIILEWSPAYVHHESPIVASHPEWFKKGPDGKIKGYDRRRPYLAWFDYSNKEVWNYQAEAMKYWLSSYEIEGFRIVETDSLPLEFIQHARWQCEMVKPVVFISDAPGGHLYKKAFDIVPSGDFYQHLVSFIDGQLPPKGLQGKILEMGIDSAKLKGFYTSNFELNHTRKTPKLRFGKYRKAMALLALSMPGPFIMYFGQETSQNKPISLTTKSPVRWEKLGMETIYREMFRLHRHNPAMQFGHKGGQLRTIELGGETDSVIALCRMKGKDKVISLFNLGTRHAHLTLADTLFTGEYLNLITQKRVMYVAGDKVVLRPLECWVLEN